MEVLWDCLRVTSSRPYGTFRLLNFYPGLRPGLSSAKFSRPCGTHFAIGKFSPHTQALIGPAWCGTAEEAVEKLGFVSGHDF